MLKVDVQGFECRALSDINKLQPLWDRSTPDRQFGAPSRPRSLMDALAPALAAEVEACPSVHAMVMAFRAGTFNESTLRTMIAQKASAGPAR